MTFDLGALIEGKLFAFLLVFCRVGAIFMTMPGIGEVFVPARIRLQFALLFSFILLPLLAPSLPLLPTSTAKTVELIVLEVGVGIFIGAVMRILLVTLETVGQIIAMQIGLSNAMIMNPTMASQGSLPGALLSLLALVVIFESGLLELMLRGLVQSYTLFKPGMPWPVGDMTEFFSHAVNDSFSVALRLAAPFMIVGTVFQLTGGLLVKMIPQMQIFFVAAPLQIVFGLAIFALSVGTIITFWAQSYEAGLTRLFTGG